MKAAVFNGPGDIVVSDIPEPDIGDGDVLIKVKACGVCGTDLHVYHGGEGSAPVNPPVVLGHEFSGEVVKVGHGVKTLKPGDRVAVDPNIYCGECEYCRTGKKELCERLKAIGVNYNGGFEEYCAVPAKQVYRLPDTVDFVSGAMMEPLACCIHGMDLAEVKAGDTVLVLGGGAIGLIMMQLARLSGAAKVVVSEPVEMRRSLALKLGADVVVNPIENDLKAALSISGISGADVVIECVGSKVTARQAFDVAKKGGRIVLFGVAAVNDEVVLKPFDVYQKQLTIKGSFINPDTNYRAVELLGSGRINVKDLVTHKFHIDDINDAFNGKKDERIKTMIVF
ncbi:zinc-dependent alcohol dehydrogenase family protein [Caldanaerobius polysaccharolyticus]|uniref:zinc-dependent alcohol dehydrogenase family protein n=1 Tax=Caldanaerobius polysaccharolyticus TaxID=44256 RepID=UPI0004786CBD|nr:zinc-dependent alcohol dehydrogenase family protein [Caldanaerobius polysaccharolyticus]